MKLIYTGYKWRPMKTGELAIMCKGRILPAKPDNPVAGDIINVERGAYKYGHPRGITRMGKMGS